MKKNFAAAQKKISPLPCALGLHTIRDVNRDYAVKKFIKG